MIVRRYNATDDFEQVKSWGKGWRADYNADQFPEVGFIVEGVAAYFLYQTDSTCCWLENMVTKKDVDHHVREEALELIIDAILTEAKALGFTVAYASTDRYQVALRAKKYGATVQPNHLLLTLKLD